MNIIEAIKLLKKGKILKRKGGKIRFKFQEYSWGYRPDKDIGYIAPIYPNKVPGYRHCLSIQEILAEDWEVAGETEKKCCPTCGKEVD